MNRPWPAVFAFTPLFLSAQAAAAPTAELPGPELSGSAKLVVLVAKARMAGSASNDAAVKAKDEAVVVAAEQKQLLTRLTTQRRDFKRHLTAARSASQRHQQRVQAATSAPADQVLVETARKEYAAATELAASIREDTKKLRALQATLSARLNDAASAAAAAQARQPEAQQHATELNTLVTRARSDAQSAGTSLSSFALSARAKAAVAPAGYPARRTRLAADDTKLQTALAATEIKWLARSSNWVVSPTKNAARSNRRHQVRVT
jgi:hypothetical protein